MRIMGIMGLMGILSFRSTLSERDAHPVSLSAAPSVTQTPTESVFPRHPQRDRRPSGQFLRGTLKEIDAHRVSLSVRPCILVSGN
jgi:hypothetical protein